MSSIDLRVPSSLHKLALRSVAIHPGAIELRRTPRGGEFAGDGLRHEPYTGLCGGIEGQSLGPLHAGNRGDLDDRASASVDHPLGR